MPLVPGPAQALPGAWEAYGHSYFMTTVGTLYQSGRTDAVLRSLLSIEHTDWRNHCVTGAQVTNQGRAQGGYARMLQECVKSTRTKPYAASGGGAILCWGINDIGISGNSTQIQAAYKSAMRTCVSLWRAASIKQDSDATITYGAGFTQATGTQDFTFGSTIHRATATTGATVTITLPADYNGQTIAACFIGAAGAFGGTGSWSGTASFATGTLSTSGIMPSTSHCPVIQRFKGTAADAGKTLVFTATSVDSGGEIDFNGWWIEADNPPPVIVCNIPRLLTAGYAGYNTWTSSQSGADADIANFNAQLTALQLEFDGQVQIANLDAAMDKDLANPPGIATLYATDGVHPNEYGAARCADAILSAVRQLTPGPLGPAASLQVDAPRGGPVRLPRLSGQWYMPQFGAWDATAFAPTATGEWYTFAIPMVVTEARERWIQAQCEVVSSASTGSSIRWGIYDDVGWTGYPQDLVVEFTSAGAFALGSGAGMKQSPASGAGSVNQPLDPGLYWFAIKMDAVVATLPTFRAIRGPNPYMSDGGWVAGTQGTDLAWRVTGTSAGALPATFPTGAVSVGTAAGSCPAVGVKIY